MAAPALVRALRPRQWVKNILVLAAPLAAGDLGEAGTVRATLLAFVCFCAASSASYLLNDYLDREADRLHPVKSARPIASGQLSGRSALLTAAGLAVLAVTGAFLTRLDLGLLLTAYLATQVGYSLWFKHEPVLDLATVASGFLMRAVAGGLAADLPLSQWFLLVSGFGSLFMVAGKRYSELRGVGVSGTRRSLVRYTDTYLRFVWSTAAGATLMSYSLWAFERGAESASPWHAISIAPFVIGLLRYAVRIDAGIAGEPEEIIYGDRVLQVIGLLWLAVVLLGVLDA